MNTDDHFEELIINWLHDQLSSQEKEEFQKLQQQPDATSKIESFHKISLAAQQFTIPSPDTTTALKQLWKRKRQYQIRKWSKYAAILLLPLSVFIGLILYIPTHDEKINLAGIILETTNGETINLSDIKNTLEIEGEYATISVTKKGELSYIQQNTSSSKIVKTSKITIPKGYSYKLQLCDGTIVHLNSATQLSYPEVFTKDERRVTISGEALFEVKPENNRPFIVEIVGMQINVMGTTFNINTYQKDQPSATLIEGKIKAITQTDTVILSPGEMVIANNQQLIVQTVDTTKIKSWITGKLFFSDTKLEDIIENICRWHNLEVNWKVEILKNKKITGVIYRELPPKVSLEMLEKTIGDGICFQINNQIIEINQK